VGHALGQSEVGKRLGDALGLPLGNLVVGLPLGGLVLVGLRVTGEALGAVVGLDVMGANVTPQLVGPTVTGV
jgi:hypothetical protein